MKHLTKFGFGKIILAALLLAACQTTPPKNPEEWMKKYPNSCVPMAISFKKTLEKQGIWSRVLFYQYLRQDGTKFGHAMTVYMYPPGKNQMWTYDFMGSYRTRAWKDEPLMIARTAHGQRMWMENVISAEFLD